MTRFLARCLLAAALAVLPAVAGIAQEAPETGSVSFVTGVEDLPLMAGLDEDVEAGFWFDKPSGRIVEAVASGAVNRRAVAAFYAETLPQLGWSDLDPLKFEREGEVLQISISGGDGDLTVRFSLSPN